VYVRSAAILNDVSIYSYFSMALNQKYSNMNEWIGKWLKRTLWLWLPIHALFRLSEDVIAKHTKK